MAIAVVDCSGLRCTLGGGAAAFAPRLRQLDRRLAGGSIPTFWLGLILIIIFGLWLRWLPISDGSIRAWGRVLIAVPDVGIAPERHLGGGKTRRAHPHPAGTDAGAWPAAIVARMTRASLIGSLGQTYVRTRGKGLPVADRGWSRRAERAAPGADRGWVGVRHLLGGAVVTETIFSWPGLGQLTVTAIGARDYQMVQGVVVLLGAVSVLLNLLVDVLYAVLDPRIRYE